MRLPIRIGLVGSGIVTAKAHIPALVRDPRFQITAFARRSVDKLAPMATMFPQAKTYGDAGELMRSGEVDCVLLASDVDAHLDQAQAALDAGLFVLVEKPVDRSAAPIRAFLEANPNRADRVMVAFNKRFHPALQKLDELRRAGQISRVVGGSLMFLVAQGRKPGRDGVLQNLIHTCDLSNWIFGAPIQVSAKFSKTLNDEKRGKTIAASILTENGCAVTLLFSSSATWHLPLAERIQVLDDDQTHAVAEDGDRLVLTKRTESGATTTIYSESNSAFWRAGSGGYEAQIQRFGDLVEGKRTAPWPSLRDALLAQSLFEDILREDPHGL